MEDSFEDTDAGSSKLAQASALLPMLTGLVTALGGLVEAIGHAIPSRHRQSYNRYNGYSSGYGTGSSYTPARRGISGAALLLLLAAQGLGGWMLPVAIQQIIGGLLLIAVGNWLKSRIGPLGWALQVIGLTVAVVAAAGLLH